MRKRRTVCLAGLLLGLAILVLLCCLPASHQPRISFETFERLHKGMKTQEAEQLIGEVPGNYCRRGWHIREGTASTWGEGGAENAFWASDYGQIMIWFDDEGTLTGASFDPYIPPTFPGETH
jgi:hypothetical protein